MGQKKTWALHHVPYSMLWDNMSLDYSHQWLAVLQGPVSSFYSSAIVDYHFKQSLFSFVWKSKFMQKRLATQQLYIRKTHLQTPTLDQHLAPVFEWTINSNRGTNETMIAKSYFIKMQNSTTLLNLFFRADFFEQKRKTQFRLAPKARAFLPKPVRQELHKRVRQLWPSTRISPRRSAKVVRKSVLGSSLDLTFGHKNSPFKNLQYSSRLNVQYYFKAARRKAFSGLRKFKIYPSLKVMRKLHAQHAKRHIGYTPARLKTAHKHSTRVPLTNV